MNSKERFRKIAATAVYLFRHSTTPEIADRARRVVEGNQNLINSWIDQGLVTVERLEEIAEDVELQKMFRQILSKTRDGGKNVDGAMTELIQMRLTSPDLIAGYFEHFRGFYEWEWGLKLLSSEEQWSKA